MKNAVTFQPAPFRKIDKSPDCGHLPSMAAGIHVNFSGVLERFIHDRVEGSGLYGSADEYIRDLVRRDLQRDEERRWDMLRAELAPGLAADESAFMPLDAATLLQKAKAGRKTHEG
jgi:antitoxin ParD1/3/4